MVKHPDQRVAVFVDVGNMYHSAKNLYNAKVNFKEVLKAGVAERKLVRAIAYVIKSKSPEEQKFFEALDSQGFEVRMKELQVYLGGLKKGDWDAGMVVDIIKMASKLDVVVLVSGDGDFVPLVEYLQSHGILVEAIGFRETTSSRLIDAVDDYFDLSSGKRKFLLR